MLTEWLANSFFHAAIRKRADTSEIVPRKQSRAIDQDRAKGHFVVIDRVQWDKELAVIRVSSSNIDMQKRSLRRLSWPDLLDWLPSFRVTRSKQVDKEREVWLGETRENSFFPLTTIMKTENYYIYWRLLLGSAKLPLRVAILLQPSQGISGMAEREKIF